ncbi:MAG: hypothetical protein ACJAY5_002014, partial [Actinomycetes bacterium]
LSYFRSCVSFYPISLLLNVFSYGETSIQRRTADCGLRGQTTVQVMGLQQQLFRSGLRCRIES